MKVTPGARVSDAHAHLRLAIGPVACVGALVVLAVSLQDLGRVSWALPLSLLGLLCSLPVAHLITVAEDRMLQWEERHPAWTLTLAALAVFGMYLLYRLTDLGIVILCTGGSALFAGLALSAAVRLRRGRPSADSV